MSELPIRNGRRNLAGYSQVLSQLEQFCGTLPVGARLPTHTALMRDLGASERVVLRALEELHRTGRVIRRNGAGTFIAPQRETEPGSEQVARLVALAEPESCFFDRCVAELFRCADAARVSLVCRPVRAGSRIGGVAAHGERPALSYLVFGSALGPLARELQDQGQRVVLMGHALEEGHWEVPGVCSDHEHGGYLAARHLLELGHSRLAFCEGAGSDAAARWRGVQRALAEAAAPLPREVLRLPADRVREWRASPTHVAKYFRDAGAPTAVLACDDRQAATLLVALARAGVSVPREVSVVGYEASPEAERVFPTLTSIDPGLCQQLQAALRLLISPAPPPPHHTLVVLPALLARESTAPPPLDA